MTDETTETEAPKGLDNILAAAIDQHMPDEAAPPAEAAPAETSPERARDASGKFVKSDKADKAEAPPQETATPPAATAAPAAEPPKALDAPAHFTAEQKASFAKLARDGQETVLSVEKAREAEYTRRSQEVAEYRRTADPFVEAISPHLDYLKQVAPQIGNTPAGMISAVIATERQLRMGSPQERYQAFAQLAQAYGVNVQALAQGQVPVQQQQPQQLADPRIDTMSRELAELRAFREREGADRQIASFHAEKDESGQPLYPYFEKVKHVMASIIQSGQADNLQDAYKMATAPIQDVIDRELASRNDAAEKARLEAVEKAKKATPVKSSSGAMPKGSSQPKGLDAHISAAMANHGM
jgi:hypothetical protein